MLSDSRRDNLDGSFVGPIRKLMILDLVLIILLDLVCIFELPLLGAYKNNNNNNNNSLLTLLADNITE